MKEHPTALVTGSSRGLGAAIAQRLAADGHAVAVSYTASAEAAGGVVSRILEAGGTAASFQADVTDSAAVEGLVAAVTDRLGPVRTLVLNATGPQPNATVPDVTWHAVLDQLAFFVRSPVLLLRAVLPGMLAAGGGRIVHIGSEVLDRLPPGASAYVAAKSAQLGLARAWARELGPAGITVNTVEPGWIPVERHAGTDPAELAEYLAGVPLRRLGLPLDVAEAVSWLASDAASFVTGARLRVTGGSTIS